jgi:hypothetical protein
LYVLPENPRLSGLGMDGILERSGGHSSFLPKALAFRLGIGSLLKFFLKKFLEI